jgi:hypothetical protein
MGLAPTQLVNLSYNSLFLEPIWLQSISGDASLALIPVLMETLIINEYASEIWLIFNDEEQE